MLVTRWGGGLLRIQLGSRKFIQEKSGFLQTTHLLSYVRFKGCLSIIFSTSRMERLAHRQAEVKVLLDCPKLFYIKVHTSFQWLLGMFANKYGLSKYQQVEKGIMVDTWPWLKTNFTKYFESCLEKNTWIFKFFWICNEIVDLKEEICNATVWLI